MQKKTQRPVQFEIMEQMRDAVATWIAMARLNSFRARVEITPSLDQAVFSDHRVLGGIDRT